MEIVLEGPAKNALGTELLQHLGGELARAGDEPVLLTGAGDTFSAGLNLKEVAALDGRGMRHFLTVLQDVALRLFHHPAPTVACVNGHAIAGGAVLARACDHAVATSEPRARIGLNEVALGLRFPPRLLQMLRFRVPARHAHTALLGAGLHGPVEAARLGLVDRVSDDPRAAAQAVLEAWAAHPRVAYAATKHDLQGHVGVEEPAAEAAFLEELLPMWTSRELRQRIRAFLGSRRSG